MARNPYELHEIVTLLYSLTDITRNKYPDITLL